MRIGFGLEKTTRDHKDYNCTRHISQTQSIEKDLTPAVETYTMGHQNKTRNTMSPVGLSIDKVHCCYIDEDNLQAIDVTEDLMVTTGH